MLIYIYIYAYIYIYISMRVKYWCPEPKARKQTWNLHACMYMAIRMNTAWSNVHTLKATYLVASQYNFPACNK